MENDELLTILKEVLEGINTINGRMDSMEGRIRASITGDLSLLTDEIGGELGALKEDFFTSARTLMHLQQTRPLSALVPLPPNGRNSRSLPSNQPAPH